MVCVQLLNLKHQILRTHGLVIQILLWNQHLNQYFGISFKIPWMTNKGPITMVCIAFSYKYIQQIPSVYTTRFFICLCGGSVLFIKSCCTLSLYQIPYFSRGIQQWIQKSTDEAWEEITLYRDWKIDQGARKNWSTAH